MPDDRPIGQNHGMKKLLLAILLLLVIAAVAFGVRTIGARDETDAVDTKDAARLVTSDDDEDLDDDDASVAVAPGSRPAPGTYSYTGSGRERVSALGGSEHVFPSEIATVVELDDDDSCEWTMNVVYVKQHIEERSFCTQDDGTVVDRGFERRIEFFRQTQETEYDCGADAVRLRPGAKAGDSWTWSCRDDDADATSAYTATFVGTETLKIGGEDVETFHTKVTSKQTGGTRGTDRSEFWLAKTGLPVKFSGNLTVKTKSVLGETEFHEQFEYALTSLVPEAT